MAAVISFARTYRPASVVAGVLLGLFFGLGVLASPALAHANLIASDPGNGIVVPQPPEQIVLTFSEPVRLVPDRIAVIGPTGEPVPIEEPRVEGSNVVIPVERVADIGTYLVSYRVISQDSHPVGGSITYSVGAPSEVPALPEADELSDSTVRTAMSVNKYLGYAGLVLIVGPVVMLTRLWPERLSRRGMSRLVWIGLGLVGFSTLAGLWLQAPYTTGQGMFEVGLADLQEVLSSTYGTALVVRLGVLASVAVLLRSVLAGQASRSDLVLITGLAAIGFGTWPFAGHAIASPIPAVSVLADAVHVAAAAFWLGGLMVLVGVLLRLANERELGAILPEWSRWAALAVSALLLAGLVMAVVEIGPPEALWTTSYGRLLLLKIGLVAVVVAVAGYSRKLVREQAAAGRPRAMRVAVGVEAVVLALVLAVSSVLVQTTPGRTEAAAPAAGGSGDYVTTLESQLFSLEVLVIPAEQGNNSIHLYAYSPAGEPQRVEEWTVTAALSGAEGEAFEPIQVPVLPLTDNHAIGEVTLPLAGEWEFRMTLRLSEIDQGSVTATVPIR